MPPKFSITVSGSHPQLYEQALKATQAGAAILAGHLVGSTELFVHVRLTELEGATAEVPSVDAYEIGGIWESAALRKLKTGIDANGDQPEIELLIDPDMLSLFTPTVAAHELLHGLAFYGDGGHSPIDALMHAGKFLGEATQAIHGAPLPMLGNHYLVPGLMNIHGPALGHSLSALDLAIMKDSGVPIRATFGTAQDDFITAIGAGSEAFAGFGADTAYGRQGEDTFWGGEGGDLLRGGKGNDQLFGEAGPDTLWGDLGQDTLNGGYGADLFMFRVGDGQDYIRQFEVHDRIALPSLDYTVLTDCERMTVTIAYEGGEVILEGTTSFSSRWVIQA